MHTKPTPSPATTDWHRRSATDGVSLDVSVVREYWQESLKPALRWYWWDVQRHQGLYCGLALLRVLAALILIRCLAAYAGQEGLAGLHEFSLADGIAVARQYPVQCALFAGVMTVSFRRITFWLRKC